MLGESLHRLASGIIGVCDQQHFLARERLPVRPIQGSAPAGPCSDELERKSVVGTVSALLTLDHDDGAGVLGDIGEPVKRARRRHALEPPL